MMVGETIVALGVLLIGTAIFIGVTESLDLENSHPGIFFSLLAVIIGFTVYALATW